MNRKVSGAEFLLWFFALAGVLAALVLAAV
jgi:hypothetical protein